MRMTTKEKSIHIIKFSGKMRTEKDGLRNFWPVECIRVVMVSDQKECVDKILTKAEYYQAVGTA